MERKIKQFILSMFKKYDEYDLYNYLNSNFIEEAQKYIFDSQDNKIVDFLSDSAYELDLNYYDYKNKYDFDKAHKILVDDVKKLKLKVLKMLD